MKKFLLSSLVVLSGISGFGQHSSLFDYNRSAVAQMEAEISPTNPQLFAWQDTTRIPRAGKIPDDYKVFWTGLLTGLTFGFFLPMFLGTSIPLAGIILGSEIGRLFAFPIFACVLPGSVLVGLFAYPFIIYENYGREKSMTALIGTGIGSVALWAVAFVAYVTK